MWNRQQISILIVQGLILILFAALAAGSASSNTSNNVKDFGRGFIQGYERSSNGYTLVGSVNSASECIELCKEKGFKEWSMYENSPVCYCK